MSELTNILFHGGPPFMMKGQDSFPYNLLKGVFKNFKKKHGSKRRHKSKR
jgi:hypothetical protein